MLSGQLHEAQAALATGLDTPVFAYVSSTPPYFIYTSQMTYLKALLDVKTDQNSELLDHCIETLPMPPVNRFINTIN